MSTTVQAYGSITIVDITDVGEFSVYPTSNSPLSVIYNPDDETFTPDWGENNLKLIPKVYYAGTALSLTGSNPSVVWTRQDGILAEGSLISGETNSNGTLTVSTNVLKPYDEKNNPDGCQSGLITYICTATYLEPDSQKTLTATGQITFTLIKHAKTVKECKISGENIFKYNANGVVEGAGKTTLEAITKGGASIKGWYYKNGDNWPPYPTTVNNSSTSGTSLVVSHTDDVFTDDVAIIKLETDDESVFDIHSITKLRDGAPGEGTVVGSLDNDDEWIPCDSSGNPKPGAFQGAVSTITILEGGVDVTSSWTVVCTPEKVQGTQSGNTYTITGFVNEENITKGKVTFTCTKTGYAPVVKHFTVTKLTAAIDGISPSVYQLKASHQAINRSEQGNYTPTSVKFSATVTTENTTSSYSGRFKIYEGQTLKYSSGSNENEKSYTPSSTTVSTIRCELYAAGGFTTKLDSEEIVVVSDGEKGDPGDQGPQGVSATNVVLGNYADIIPCKPNGRTKQDTFLKIPFAGYLGTTQVACSVVPSGYPSAMTITQNTAGTDKKSGEIIFKIDGNTLIENENTQSGTITLTFTCNKTNVIHYYQWSKSIQAENAVIFEILSPSGNIIHNGGNSVTLEARLMDGTTEIRQEADKNPPTVTFYWRKYGSGGYPADPTATGQTITVNPSDVSGYASYKCSVSYSGESYNAYYYVLDKTDPLQAQVHCSFGTQLLNGQGCGAVYTKLYQNGVEIDPLKSERFLTSAPASGSAGEYYYHLDSTNKSVVLKKYSGTGWIDAPSTELPTGSYTYTFRNKDGVIDESKTVTEKVFYIDGDFIDKRVVIDVTAQITQ